MSVLPTHTLTDCECKAKVYSDGSGVDIEYCELHGSAPELFDALVEVDQIIENEMYKDGFEIKLNTWVKNVMWPLAERIDK